MIRIIDTRGLVVFGALFAALGLSACTQNAGDDVVQKDDELNQTHIVDVSGNAPGSGRSADSIEIPANAAHPMTRIGGPHPEPWNDPEEGPHPEPWRGGNDDGNGNGGSSSGKPGDPSNPNQ